MSLKLAINGFGRIGRAAFKIAVAHEGIDVVAINDLGDIDNLAYLLRYDSVYGRYGETVTVKGGNLVVGGEEFRVVQGPDPLKLPWKELDVDVVIESTGVFTEEEQARGHIKAGAKKVIISAPSKSETVPTIVIGVNDDEAKGKDIISSASCTTNCVAPVMRALQESFKVEKALLTTAHAYTATQLIVDGPAKKDFRRGRSAAINMVPASTGAAVASAKALPELEGKFDGVAIRVPVPVVSISDITALLKKNATVEDINKVLRKASKDPSYMGVLAVTDEEVASTDFIGDPHSAIVDLLMTRVVDGNLVKIMAWYDNEWGYSNRLIEQVVEIGKQ